MKTVGMLGAGLLLLTSCATGPQEQAQSVATPTETTEDATLQTLRDLGLTPEEMLEIVREKWAMTPAPDAGGAAPSGQGPDTGSVVTNSEAAQEAGTVVEVASSAEAPPPPQETPVATSTVVVTQADTTPEVVVVHAPEVREVTVFYEALAPYGWWLELAPYGRVWRPAVTVVDVEWRPYCHGGHWLWTDWGWYWASSYSWGWITFHYGRWHYCPEYRWVWVPDLVWAPAWVTWRVTPDYCGWAPLPPSVSVEVELHADRHDGRDDGDRRHGLRDHHYTFVPRHRLHERDLPRLAVPRNLTATLYRESRFVPNAWRREGERLVNLGPRGEGPREQRREHEHRLRLVNAPPAPPRPAAPRDGRNVRTRRLPADRRESGPSLRLADDTAVRRSVRTDPAPQQGPARPELASAPRVASRPEIPVPRAGPADRTASHRRQDGDRGAVHIPPRVEPRPAPVPPTAPPAVTLPVERPSRPAEAVPERRVVERRQFRPASEPPQPPVAATRPPPPVSEHPVIRTRVSEQRPPQLALERPVAIRQPVEPRVHREAAVRGRRENRVVTLMPPVPAPETAPRVEERPHPQRWLEAPAAGTDRQRTVRDPDRPHRAGRVRSAEDDGEHRRTQ